jgi:hypothetical protein
MSLNSRKARHDRSFEETPKANLLLKKGMFSRKSEKGK